MRAPARGAGGLIRLLALIASIALTVEAAGQRAGGAETSAELWKRFQAVSDAHARTAEQLAALDQRAERLDSDLRATQSRFDALKDDVRKIVLRRYQTLDQQHLAVVSSYDEARDEVTRQAFTRALLGLHEDDVTQLIQVRDALDATRQQVDRDRAERAQLNNQLATELTELRAAATLASAQEAAAAEAARAAAERARKAREAELARQLAAQRAAQARASRSSSTSRSSGSSKSEGTNNGAPTTRAPSGPPPNGSMLSAAQLSALRQCESGGNYQNKSNPAYRGAYQIARGTWDITVVRMHRPDLVGLDPADASPADQDAAAQTIYQADGLRAWPTCGANL